MRHPFAVAGPLAAVLLLAACGSDTVAGRGSGGSTTPTATRSTSSASSSGSAGTAPTSAGSASSNPAAGAQGAYLTDPATVGTVVAAARRDLQTINTYDYRHLGTDLAAGTAATTGPLREQYRASFQQVIAPNAPARHASQQMAVGTVAVGTLTPQRAVLLVAAQLTVSNTSLPSPRTDPVTAQVGVQLVDGRWLMDSESTTPSLAGDPPGTPALAAAVTAARTGVTDLLTASRASFDRDYDRALAGTTGALHSDVAGRRTATRQALVSGRFDLAATVDAAGVVSASGAQVVVLVQASGYRLTAGTRGTPTPQTLQVTVVRVQGRWLMSDLTAVGLH